MFRIESYITPIIINYVDKYVKNFRPQDAQVKEKNLLNKKKNVFDTYFSTAGLTVFW